MQKTINRCVVPAVFAIALILTSCSGAEVSTQRIMRIAAIDGTERVSDDLCTEQFRLNIERLLAHSKTNMMTLSARERDGISAAADGVRWPKYGPLFAFQVRNAAGKTNIVYIEANYPWCHPNYLELRVSLIRPTGGSKAHEFKVGSRIYPDTFDIVTNAEEGSGGGELLVIHASEWGGANYRLVFSFPADPVHEGLFFPSPVRIERFVRVEGDTKGQWYVNKCELKAGLDGANTIFPGEPLRLVH